jgi:putative selenate reductase
MATDLLKPGGYQRLFQMAKIIEQADGWNKERIDIDALDKLADESLSVEYSQKSWRGTDKVSVPGGLPMTDCYIAPCVAACPIHQDVPEYIRLVGEKKYNEALELIYHKNALPAITGHICDHQCQYSCTRLDYEGAVRIREMKRIAVEEGWKQFRENWKKPEITRQERVAVVGAGPAGLSAAFFLAREGFPVTVLEKQDTPGGVVGNIVPKFRIPEEVVFQDISFVEAHGVEFRYGVSPGFTVGELKKEYDFVCLALGAEAGSNLSYPGGNESVYEALDFLRSFNIDPSRFDLGTSVGVIGAGSTAMDCARAALRSPGVKDVSVIYRRSEAQMPVEPEEFEDAVADGVKFLYLLNPEGYEKEGTLHCRVMKLGEKDSSGRPRPVPTDEVRDLKIDSLITATGTAVDRDLLARIGLPPGDRKVPEVDPETLETPEENVFILGDGGTGFRNPGQEGASGPLPEGCPGN